MATQQELDAGSDWTHGVHQELNTKLEYEYRIMCSNHYYGNDCDTLCRPRNDQFGHYTCDNNGNKICLDGWQKDPNNSEAGDYCTKRKNNFSLTCSEASLSLWAALLLTISGRFMSGRMFLDYSCCWFFQQIINLEIGCTLLLLTRTEILSRKKLLLFS